MVLIYIKHLLFPPQKKPSTPLLPTAAPPPKTYGTATDPPKRPPCLDPRVLSDLTIGLSDGLTVPFALTAGLSAFNDTRVVLYGGLAELIAGSISMGLGGWLAGRGEAQFRDHTRRATAAALSLARDGGDGGAGPLLRRLFSPFGVPDAAVGALAEWLAEEEGAGEAFLMRFLHGVDVGGAGRTPVSSAATIAAGYFLGGFVPLVPYVFVGRGEVLVGLRWSVVVMVVCLFAFGGGKAVLVGGGAAEEGEGGGWGWGRVVRGGVEMVVVGGVAAAAAMGIVRALGGMS